MLMQNDKKKKQKQKKNRLNRNKNPYRLNESSSDSSMTDLLPSTQKSLSNSDTPQFTRTPKQISMTDLSHNQEVRRSCPEVFLKKLFFHKIHRKTPVPESLFLIKLQASSLQLY